MKRVGVCILLLFVVITAVQLLDQASLHDSEKKYMFQEEEAMT